MKVKYLNDCQMLKEFGIPYEGQPSCIYGLFSYNDGQRYIYVLEGLSVKGKIGVLIHEIGHWAFSYLMSIHEILDSIWDFRMDRFWHSITKYYW